MGVEIADQKITLVIVNVRVDWANKLMLYLEELKRGLK